MSTALDEEIEAINAIYGDGTIMPDGKVHVLKIPSQSISFRIEFPPSYPDAPPSVLGTQNSGAQKGDAATLLDSLRVTVGKVWNPGEVCLFDVIEDLNSNLDQETEVIDEEVHGEEHVPQEEEYDIGPGPPWVISERMEEKKSVFVARCAFVESPDQAKKYVHHLLSTDKKAAKATHNITAWRIKGKKETTYQDCDDDGETAAGGRLLHLMQLMDVWNVMVVVTRWYGGIQLGPDRFRLIGSAARDALVRGGYVVEQGQGGVKKRGKK